MDDALKKHFYVYSSTLICMCYSYFISLRTRKGFFRLILLLPAICLLPILPLYLPHIFISVYPTTCAACMITGRLIIFAFGHGPTASAQSLYSFLIYAAVNVRSPSSRFPFKLTTMSMFGLQVLAIATLIGTTQQYKQDMHSYILVPLYICLVILSMDCHWAIVKYFRPMLLGLDLEPMFHEPYLSTSLQDFWGRRWNLTVSDQLRDMVYNPVKSVWAPVPASLATFFVSGLIHELLLYYATRAPPTWEMTSFFLLHGIVVVLEVTVKKAFKGRLDLPPFVSATLTVGFLILTFVWLYYPPLNKSGALDMVLKEVRCLGEFALNGIALLV